MAFVPKIQALFSNFQEWAGETSLPPPLVRCLMSDLMCH